MKMNGWSVIRDAPLGLLILVNPAGGRLPLDERSLLELSPAAERALDGALRSSRSLSLTGTLEPRFAERFPDPGSRLAEPVVVCALAEVSSDG